MNTTAPSKAPNHNAGANITQMTPTTQDAHNTIDAQQHAHTIRIAQQALQFGTEQLPHDITERLRVMRLQALQNMPKPAVVQVSQPTHIGLSQRITQWLQHITHSQTWLKTTSVALGLAAVGVVGVQMNEPLSVPTSQAALMQPANTTLANAAVVDPSQSDADAEVSAVLQEEIPLQAYLNKEFNQYTARHLVKTRQNNATPETHNRPKHQ